MEVEAAREPPVVLESKPLETSEEFESRRLMEENIIAAFNDDNISTIGIYGSGGIGKTRMARRFGERVKRDKLFKVVMMVRVGPSSDLKKIAYEISDYLSVRFEGGDFVARANELLSKLIMEERVLIILDDVRGILNLEKIGIPLQKHNGSYKILITSRFKRVCVAMGCHEIFEVRGLTKEDIWNFLSEKFGNSLDSSDLHSLASFVAYKHKGLPLVLAVVGRMLKDKNKLWPDAQKNLTPAMSPLSTLLPQVLAGASYSPKKKAVYELKAEAMEAISSLVALNLRNSNLGQSTVRIHHLIRSIALSGVRTRLIYFRPSFLLGSSEINRDIFSASEFVSRAPSNSKIKHDILSAIEFLSTALQVLDLRDADIRVLPGEMKKLVNLRLLNLTNCRNLQIIERGLLSSLVGLEELYMLGSFNEWEVEIEGKGGRNASINELEFLPNLTALQIQIQDPSVIPKSSRIWSRLTVHVVSAPEELKCRYQESLHVSFPAVNLDDYYWQFQRAMDFYLPSLTSLIDWICVMLRSAEYLCLKGDGSKNAVDKLIPDGFKLLKELNIGHCRTMEYLVNGVDQVVPTNGFFPLVESLCLEDLPLFKEIFKSELPVGMFAELRNLKLYRLPALLHVGRSRTQDVSFSNLRSIHISHCPKLQSLFSLSMARDMVQLEEIKLEYCEMIEEIFSEDKHEHGRISNKIRFSKLNHLELDTLPHLTAFCKNVRVEFPQLREMCIQSLQKLRIFCPTEGAFPIEGNDSNSVQCLFNEKVAFDSLKKLEITELTSATGIWSHQSSQSLFSELEVLVVASCDTLKNLFSHSIAQVLVQLEHLIIEDCFMMQEVIAQDGEIEQLATSEFLFPQLRKLELRRLPTLESFCRMMHGLVLPSLEDLTLYDCPGMKEFSGGTLHMPVLRCVKKDLLIYRIDGINFSVQRLFDEKHLFVHNSWLLSCQYEGAQEELMEEEGMKESINSHLARSSESSEGEGGVNLQYDMHEERFCSTSNRNTMIEELVAYSSKSYRQELGEKRWDGDVSIGRFHLRTKARRGQTERICNEAKSKVSLDMVLHNKRYLNDFILFCSIFPSGYEFTKDILVWQWIAGGLISSGDDEIIEEACIKCFDALLSMEYIVAARYDHFIDQMKYKLGDKMITFLQKQSLEPKFRKYLDSKQIDVGKVEHLSLAFEDIDNVKFGVLKQYSRLRTLIIHHYSGSKVNCLPTDLFLELKALKILNLGHSNIVELPSSIENLKELRYLDVSDTPIGWLPEIICCFRNLQTLKLDGCLSLGRLPKCTSELINLRHLVLDVVRQLQSMPIGIGKLSKLRTLTAFLVGEDDGCRIRELKDMNKLRGSFRVLNLENVRTKEEAAEACLCSKGDLRKIELQWSDLQDEKNPYEEEILESLQPPSGIQELKILFYSGGALPSWICDPSFSKLVRIILYRCRYYRSLPSLGELPSLKHLSVIENNEVVEISSFFCRKQIDQQYVAFPKLEKLSFDSMSELEKWSGLENGDFPSLRHLIIEDCPKFVSLPRLSHLSSLLHLEISYCPELSCLPEDGLPSTLESLMIKDCPKLKERCCNEQCEDWSKVAHVPGFYIDNRKVSS